MKYKFQFVESWKYDVKLECGHTVIVNPQQVYNSKMKPNEYFQCHRVQCRECGLMHDLQDISANKFKNINESE